MSEKIEILKEIRWENKYIDFIQALDKEPNILKDKDIVCPKRGVAALFESHVMLQCFDINEEVEIIKIKHLNFTVLYQSINQEILNKNLK